MLPRWLRSRQGRLATARHTDFPPPRLARPRRSAIAGLRPDDPSPSDWRLCIGRPDSVRQIAGLTESRGLVRYGPERLRDHPANRVGIHDASRTRIANRVGTPMAIHRQDYAGCSRLRRATSRVPQYRSGRFGQTLRPATARGVPAPPPVEISPAVAAGPPRQVLLDHGGQMLPEQIRRRIEFAGFDQIGQSHLERTLAGAPLTCPPTDQLAAERRRKDRADASAAVGERDDGSETTVCGCPAG